MKKSLDSSRPIFLGKTHMFRICAETMIGEQLLEFEKCSDACNVSQSNVMDQK